MSSSPSLSTRPRTEVRPALTVLSGFSGGAGLAVARTLQAADPELLLIRHDLAGRHDGTVRRRVGTATAELEDVRIPPVHGCGSCTLREDMLPTLLRLAAAHPGRDQLLLLPDTVSPDTVAACAHGTGLRIDSYVTVIDPATFLDDLGSGDDLADRGRRVTDNDRRTIAQLLCHQVEAADTVLIWGGTPGAGLDLVRLQVMLHRLAPWATHLTSPSGGRHDGVALAAALRHTRRRDPVTPTAPTRSLDGYAVGVHEPVADCGVVSAVFRARRPFHPGRLHETLGTITGDCLRTRGVCWFASQPDTAVAWESAGGAISLASLGRWLAAVPDARWSAEAGDARRLAAALEWDPYYGDRHTHLALIGVDFDPAELHRLLTDCLVTDAELAEGEEGWRSWEDPFAGCFPIGDA